MEWPRQFEVGSAAAVVDEPTDIPIPSGSVEAEPPDVRDAVGRVHHVASFTVLGVLFGHLMVKVRPDRVFAHVRTSGDVFLSDHASPLGWSDLDHQELRGRGVAR